MARKIDITLSNTNDKGEDKILTPEEKEQELLKEARTRFSQASEAQSPVIEVMKKDFAFHQGEQWDEAVKTQRIQDKRPVYTVNVLPQYVNQIINNIRKQKPALKCLPVDDQGDIETAKVYNGIIRNIENHSQASIAYDTAASHAVIAGRGFVRICTDWIKGTFDQEIQIKRVFNPFSVLIGPHTEPTARDARWGFVVETISKDEFKATYPDSKISRDASGSSWENTIQTNYEWSNENEIQIAEYFYLTEEPDRVMRMTDDSVWYESEWNEQFPDVAPPIKQPEKENVRDESKPKWMWAKLTGNEVLESGEWLGDYLPIVPIIGNEFIDTQGQTMLSGVIRNAKDAQVIYNAGVSNKVETIALAPKAPFIAEEGQITKQNMVNWLESNIRSVGVLTYKGKSIDGSPVGAPQRAQFSPDTSASSALVEQANNDIKRTTGMYDDSLGSRSNGTSGRAIIARQEQGDNANFQYIDNVNRAIQHIGVIIVDLIPKIYKRPQVISIMGEDNQQELVAINQLFRDDLGQEKQFMLSEGQYNVVIIPGPSFNTRRAEQTEALMDLASKVPSIMEKAPDIVFAGMDFPGAQELAERFAPPGTAKGGQKPEQLLQQAVMAVNTLKQQAAALDAHAQQVEGDLQKTTQELEAMKLKNQDYSERNGLDALKMRQEKELETRKLALQEQKQKQDFYIAQKKLQIEAASALSNSLSANDPNHIASKAILEEIDELESDEDNGTYDELMELDENETVFDVLDKMDSEDEMPMPMPMNEPAELGNEMPMDEPIGPEDGLGENSKGPSPMM